MCPQDQSLIWPSFPPSAESIALPRSPFKTAEISRPTGLLGRLVWTAALTVVFGGCRAAAYRDVYQQKMASEIRVLEDQLYDADYQNQVLRDELMRFELKDAQVVIPESRPRRTIFGKTLSDSGEVIDAPKADPAPRLPARPLQSTAPRKATSSPQAALQPPLADAQSEDNLVPPSEPVPPGPTDLMIPDVELGDPMPPPEPDAASEGPPGRVAFPDSAKRLSAEPLRQPIAIRIQPSLSGGHKTDDEPAVEGLLVVVEAVDERGSVVSLDQFDIDAELSIVLLDPAQPGATARLGKWDFGPDQIREMVHRDLASAFRGRGLRVVIPWGNARPQAASVIAHVRLGSGDAVMQTEAEIATAEPTMARWTPRAAMTR